MLNVEDNIAGLRLLEDNCNNYTIHNRDNVKFRYSARCSRFFAYGSGVGHTLLEAATRALRIMNLRDSRIPRASLEELLSI